MIRSVVRGFGAALPKRVVTNQELESKVDTSDEWIVQRTGIRQRYIAGEGETTASLGEGRPVRRSPMPGLRPMTSISSSWRPRRRTTRSRPRPSTSRTGSVCAMALPLICRQSVPVSSMR